MRMVMLLSFLLLLPACTVGPDYVRPQTIVPPAFKEAPAGWKYATPSDACDRGDWWTVFDDSELNQLVEQLNALNQNIQLSIAQYDQARALINQAKAAYYPTASVSSTVTREKESVSDVTTAAIVPGTSGASSASAVTVFNLFNETFSATWEPDLWGTVRRNVESTVATAQADAAQIALTRLLAQASLAQYYFQLRGLDANQVLLDKTVADYEKILKISRHQYHAGTVSQLNVVQTESLLQSAQAAAIDNRINRAIFEHAIAVLVGQTPTTFSLAPNPLVDKAVSIPMQIPSQWLERRPDIAQTERQMASANALIGVAISAYYPVLTLTGTGGYQASHLRNLFKTPAQFWSIGAMLAETVFDGGLRSANVAAARAVFEQTVATYKQTVLTAFQDVEDNLASLRILEEEEKILKQAVVSAEIALRIAMNEYKAGTAQLSDVLNAEIIANNARLNASNVITRRMVSAALLIKALGGGWDESKLPIYGCCTCQKPEVR